MGLCIYSGTLEPVHGTLCDVTLQALVGQVRSREARIAICGADFPDTHAHQLSQEARRKKVTCHARILLCLPVTKDERDACPARAAAQRQRMMMPWPAPHYNVNVGT